MVYCTLHSTFPYVVSRRTSIHSMSFIHSLTSSSVFVYFLCRNVVYV
jgi:hypothetical protein